MLHLWVEGAPSACSYIVLAVTLRKQYRRYAICISSADRRWHWNLRGEV